ncbi:hypothetical protein GCT13_30030 [Paraburkholderia sp. CNPSo 3157]|uniref:Uncharacterized protein n=1 Tax=Paraburkholderia franconis TaxID=2654983 RepID=A0A7X1TJ18_9BURK|nr:hypothetical protein [Paraburkholderia franconis]MPW20996.1 hypothetical protein [Paraburkholderia franconis]
MASNESVDAMRKDERASNTTGDRAGTGHRGKIAMTVPCSRHLHAMSATRMTCIDEDSLSTLQERRLTHLLCSPLSAT